MSNTRNIRQSTKHTWILVLVCAATILTVFALIFLLHFEQHKPAASNQLEQTALSGQPERHAQQQTDIQRNVASQPAAKIEREEKWEVCLISGKRVGYNHSIIEPATYNGQPAIKITEKTHLVLQRFGSKLVDDTTITTWETPDGQLLELKGTFSQGNPVQVHAVKKSNKLHLSITTKGKTQSQQIALPAEKIGVHMLEIDLKRRPIRPGEKRRYLTFVPGFNVIAEEIAQAKQHEVVDLLDGKHTLLRVETITRLPNGINLPGVCWVDGTGEIRKLRLDFLFGLETIAATRSQALAEPEALSFDFGNDIAVAVDQPIDKPHETFEVTYIVQLPSADPATLFVSSIGQKVEPIDAHTARVIVRRVRPDSPILNTEAMNDPPTEGDLASNNYIQSDYPRIVEMAQEAVAGRQDPWEVATALEQLAHDWILQSDYTHGFATAAEVADNRAGDCTEHAVLLAALARACKIPARVAAGLVYSDGKFYYHMWTEVYIKDRWIPLDATLALGGIGAAHLKLAHSNLSDPTALVTLVPVLKTIGQLRIRVADVKYEPPDQ